MSQTSVKAAYIGSVSQSATLLEFINGHSPTADHNLTKMIDELNVVATFQLTQSKIQENLNEVVLKYLIEKQTYKREKARIVTLSASIRNQIIGNPKPAHSLRPLPNKFCAVVKYRLGAPMYEKELMCPILKQDH